jgi:glyoxylase-like metal-dependent hydrolase (beta-lactamase superfamily II)
LEEEGMLFAGDQVMEGTTVVIAPPDGDMAAYLASLRALLEEPIQQIAPGHGRLMQTPEQIFQGVITHRLAREDKIMTALLALRQASIPDIVARAYIDTPPFLHKLAEFSTYAHLRKLQAEGRVWPSEMDSMNALWRIIE